MARVNATLFMAARFVGGGRWRMCGHRHRELHTAWACKPKWGYLIEAEHFPLKAGDGGYFHERKPPRPKPKPGTRKHFWDLPEFGCPSHVTAVEAFGAYYRRLVR